MDGPSKEQTCHRTFDLFEGLGGACLSVSWPQSEKAISDLQGLFVSQAADTET